jgi:hypothetical protein
VHLSLFRAQKIFLMGPHMLEPRTIIWWSGGAPSAIVARMVTREVSEAIIARCETANEDPDNYRFEADVMARLGRSVTLLRSEKYASVWDVWQKRRYMAGRYGGVCTVEMKIGPRLERPEIARTGRPTISWAGYGKSNIAARRMLAEALWRERCADLSFDPDRPPHLFSGQIDGVRRRYERMAARALEFSAAAAIEHLRWVLGVMSFDVSTDGTPYPVTVGPEESRRLSPTVIDGICSCYEKTHASGWSVAVTRMAGGEHGDGGTRDDGDKRPGEAQV